MNFSALINKPEYWFRPSQIMRKLHFERTGGGPAGRRVRLPWGDELLVSAGEAIGRSILALGVHELAVSEVLWRLTDAGDTCLDVGANLGYMTSLLSARVGSEGHVHAFEPHPTVFHRLKANVSHFAHTRAITAYQTAVAAMDGTASLFEAADFKENEGTSSLVAASDEGSSPDREHPVAVRRLDSLFGGNTGVGVMKIDVEGAELDVLHGATELLRDHGIRDIVWEDHAPFPSESARVLSQRGYRIFQFSKKLVGPSFWEPGVDRDPPKLPWETPNFLATLDPLRAEARLRPRGWYCLRGAKPPCEC